MMLTICKHFHLFRVSLEYKVVGCEIEAVAFKLFNTLTLAG